MSKGTDWPSQGYPSLTLTPRPACAATQSAASLGWRSGAGPKIQPRSMPNLKLGVCVAVGFRVNLPLAYETLAGDR